MWPDAFQLVPQLQRALLEELQQAPSLEGLLGWIEVSGRVKQLESTFRKLLRNSDTAVAGEAGAAAGDALEEEEEVVVVEEVVVEEEEDDDDGDNND